MNGLYIGKLAPMHLGHELIIRRMIGECDRSVVFIYNSNEFQAQHPKLTKVLRGYWVEQRYPEVEVVLGFNPPPDQPGWEGDVSHAEFVQRNLLPEQQPDCIYGAEDWVYSFATVLNAEPCKHERDGQGISASKIRENPAQFAWYMDPPVRDWMLRNYGTIEGLTI